MAGNRTRLLEALIRCRQLPDVSSEEARAALCVLTRDLRNAHLPADDAGHFTMKRGETGLRLDFARTVWRGDRADTTAVCVRFERTVDGSHELWRDETGRSAYLAGNIVEFEVRAFDGSAWHETWGGDTIPVTPSRELPRLPLLLTFRIVTLEKSVRHEATALAPILASLLHG